MTVYSKNVVKYIKRANCTSQIGNMINRIACELIINFIRYKVNFKIWHNLGMVVKLIKKFLRVNFLNNFELR